MIMVYPFAKPDVKNIQSFNDVIDLLLIQFYQFFLLIGVIPISASVMRFFQHGFKYSYLLHVFFYLFLVIIFVLRKKNSLRKTTIVILGLSALNGIVNIATYGLASTVLMNFLFMVMLFSIFTGRRTSFLVLIATAVVLIGFAIAVCGGYYRIVFDAETYLVSTSVWVTQLTFYFTVAAIVIVFTTGIVSVLMRAFTDLKTRTEELTETNKALWEQKRNLSMLIDTAPDAIIATDLSGTIISCNHAALDLLDCSSDGEIIGKPILGFIASDDRKRATDNLPKLMEQKVLHSIEYSVVTGTGATKRIQLSASVIEDRDRKPSGLMSIIQDVTHTREIEEQLRQSEKMQAVGQLAGGVAHDFNNQLAGIVGYADLLRYELSSNPDLSHYADNILLVAKRASDLTAQLLAFARKGKYLSVSVDIHKTIAEVISILQRTIDKKIVIEQYLRAQTPTTVGDPTQLQNAILNVALNARDAMPGGGILRFSTDVVHFDREYCSGVPYEIQPGNYLEIDVGDNGSGMDDDTRRHIFEPFFTTKEQGKGTGMGLASVFGTMKNHGGVIIADSKPGEGTTMKLYVPLVEHAAMDAPVVPVTPTGADKRYNIMVVDDEEFVLDTAGRMLERGGYTVTVCRSGEEAVAVYRQQWRSIDLVVLDMVMPVRNGKDTYLELKKINPAIVALLSSGYSIDGDAQAILDEGVQGFIQKPYRFREFTNKIMEVLHSAEK